MIEKIPVPESPRHRRERFTSEYGVGQETADKLTTNLNVADFYEDIATDSTSKVAATFVVDTLLGELNYRDMEISDVEANEVSATIDALAKESVTWRSVTEIIRDALDNGEEIDEVFDRRNVEKTGQSELNQMVSDVIEEEQDAVEDYLSGTQEALNHLVGKIMARTNGQADARQTRNLFEDKLKNE
jgi:Asp-tRNAAsn/Glu-tRNAGln amidotransferase B subunit (PET112 homolog)